MSTTFRLLKTCSTPATVSRSRTGVAVQKCCKRRIHVASSTSSPSTRAPSDSVDLRSLYPHTSRRTRSTSSGLSAPSPGSKQSDQEGHMETSLAFTSETSEKMASHLNKTFGIVFPPELATRLLTHASHPVSKVVGHNARFAFIGRRVIEVYFLMFLHSCPNVDVGVNYATITSNALNTYVLGRHVALEWGIGGVLRWKSVEDPSTVSQGENKGYVGSYKVFGTTVEAIFGGVYHQFGATEAHKLFHTHLLPHILLKGTHQSVPDAYHARAMQLYKSVNEGVDFPSSPNQ